MERKKGASIKIFKVKKFNLPTQLQVPAHTDIVNEVGASGTLKNSYSYLKLLVDTKSSKTYQVEQYTQTITESIRFLLDGIRNYDSGYQRLGKFEIIYRVEDDYLFICANSEHTDLLISRFKSVSNIVSLIDVTFDFELICKIPEIKNIWGVWERVDLAHKNVNGSFGTDVHKNPEVKLAQATAVNIKMAVKDKIYTMTLSKEGRMSSNGPLTPQNLIEIFDGYFTGMIKS